MREQKNKSQKGIVVLLAFIAVCMVCIIVLLASNIITSSNQGDDTKNDVVAEIEVTEEPEDNPFYHYDGKLSDTPITPTEVENDWILKQLNTRGYEDQIVKSLNEKGYDDVADLMKKTILERAKEYECYANPTVIDCGVYPYGLYSKDIIMVDFHTKGNNIETYLYDYEAKQLYWACWSMNFEEFEPYVNEDGKHIFNANNLYTYNQSENCGYTEEELQIMQKKIMEAVKQHLIDFGLYDKYYDSIKCYVLSSTIINDKEDIYLLVYTTLSDGSNFDVTISCPFNSDSYYAESSANYDKR